MASAMRATFPASPLMKACAYPRVIGSQRPDPLTSRKMLWTSLYRETADKPSVLDVTRSPQFDFTNYDILPGKSLTNAEQLVSGRPRNQRLPHFFAGGGRRRFGPP